MPLTIASIQSAFKPAQEIKDPDHFVGRREQVKDVIIALGQEGSFIAIWGPRGVGKSSLARQLQLIANGDSKLIDRLDLSRFVSGRINFIVHYICADSTMTSIDDLARTILLGDNNSPALSSYLFEPLNTTEVKSKTAGKGTIALVGGEASQELVRKPDAIEGTHLTTLKTTLAKITSESKGVKSGLLVLIDEFERIKNVEGFASLVKTCSNEFVKFCIVGIADDITSMLTEHQSVGRNLVSVGLATMSEPELAAIIDRANNDLRPASFSDELKNQIVQTSEGFPYFVQLLGYECALDALDRNDNSISHANLVSVLDKLKSGALADIYEERYNDAVKHSEQRELLLRAFADTKATQISSTDVYQFIMTLGVSNPSQLMPPLTSSDNGEPVLEKVADRLYRFKDPLFKTYVRLRHFKFRNL